MPSGSVGVPRMGCTRGYGSVRNEIAILCHEDYVGFAGPPEDIEILSLFEDQVYEVTCFDAKLLPQPGTQSRRELYVEPELHAAMIGWFTRSLAKCRQASMSSDSR